MAWGQQQETGEQGNRGTGEQGDRGKGEQGYPPPLQFPKINISYYDNLDLNFLRIS